MLSVTRVMLSAPPAKKERVQRWRLRAAAVILLTARLVHGVGGSGDNGYDVIIM